MLQGMTQLSKAIDEWTERDLHLFIEQRAEESLVLEFKRELSLASAAGKKEAAKDVCAMANTSGGWIIYGMDEDRVPDSANRQSNPSVRRRLCCCATRECSALGNFSSSPDSDPPCRTCCRCLHRCASGAVS
jgi:hypothetical protein